MINYNIVKLNIGNGLKNHAIAGGFNYLILLDAPLNANVLVKFDNNEADGIPLKENGAIEISSEIRNIYISCDFVTNETITIGQSNTNDLKIIPSTNIQKIEEVSSFGADAQAILQFLPNDSITYTILDGESKELDISKVKAFKFFNDGVLDLEIENNGVIFPIKANECYELFCQYLDNNIVLHNNSGAGVIMKALVMGKVTININYVEDNYMISNYANEGI